MALLFLRMQLVVAQPGRLAVTIRGRGLQHVRVNVTSVVPGGDTAIILGVRADAGLHKLLSTVGVTILAGLWVVPHGGLDFLGYVTHLRADCV